ncbi:uncharacterized protein LOC144094770 [Amblyomma americanum]
MVPPDIFKAPSAILGLPNWPSEVLQIQMDQPPSPTPEDLVQQCSQEEAKREPMSATGFSIAEAPNGPNVKRGDSSYPTSNEESSSGKSSSRAQKRWRLPPLLRRASTNSPCGRTTLASYSVPEETRHFVSKRGDDDDGCFGAGSSCVAAVSPALQCIGSEKSPPGCGKFARQPHCALTKLLTVVALFVPGSSSSSSRP